jgi:hypothetical protein
MAIGDDFRIYPNGDIRYVGSGVTYTVIQFHRWLGDLMDNAQASGDDMLDITYADASQRATDNLIILVNGYNIDDYTARFLYDGSIVQDNGDTIYDGIVTFAPPGTYLQIIQDGKILSPNYWTTGYNADPSQGISHRFLVKVRSGGVDIDGRRLIGQTREAGKTYSEFRIGAGTSRGNNVIALQYADDLNNATPFSAIAGWTSITNTEGYRLIDINNDSVNEPYYSEWNRDSYSINQLYERAKWLTRRGTTLDSCSDIGSDFPLGNGTITAQGQSFSTGVNQEYIRRAFFNLKKVGSPTGSCVARLYAMTGTHGSSAVPTGSALATSSPVPLSSITSFYTTVEFSFPVTSGALMSASTNYVIVVEYTDGNASNYLHVRGLASTGTHSGNRSSYSGSWSAAANDDLNFTIHSSPRIYNLPGELFRGITHELTLTTPRSGTFNATELVSWSTGTGAMLAIDSQTAGTKMWIQLLNGTPPASGTTITGSSSGATATTSGAPVERPLSFPFIGASTGSAIIGGYGVGIEYADLTAADKLFDLTNTQRVPPNNVTFSVLGLVPGVNGDRVLVGPGSGGALQYNQFTLNTALTGASETAVVVNSAIPSDTPATGTIRVQLNSGIYRRVPYNSYSGNTFSIPATDFTSDPASANNNVFISYIDKQASSSTESFTAVYLADRQLFVRVRNGGPSPIKTFETTGTLGSAGGSATVIRTPDV